MPYFNREQNRFINVLLTPGWHLGEISDFLPDSQVDKVNCAPRALLSFVCRQKIVLSTAGRKSPCQHKQDLNLLLIRNINPKTTLFCNRINITKNIAHMFSKRRATLIFTRNNLQIAIRLKIFARRGN